jgi:hypothetical protein
MNAQCAKNTQKQETNKMARWKDGQSGNPNGRPRGSRNKSTAEIRDLLDKHVSFDDLVAKLYALARKGNVKAAEILLEYRYGKPKASDELRIEGRVESDEMRKAAEETLAKMRLMTPNDLSQELVSRLRVSSRGVESSSGD